ncbi:MAG TPA: ATP-binding protein [archaeon]|nr:ATP-binding protein [archaeon]
MGSEKLKFDSCVTMTVPMEANQELKVAERAEELAVRLGFERDPIDEIKLALIEAVINAIEHGSSPERKVFITFGLNRKPRRMAIVISDSGSGFDPGAVEIPDIKKKMQKGTRKRGWGLKIMRSLMDEVRVESSRGGTQITLIKNG